MPASTDKHLDFNAATEKLLDFSKRYLNAIKAMSRGVLYLQSRGVDECDPVPLRVGVNDAMLQHGALVKLLFDKGTITKAEYTQALAEAAEADVKRYEQRIVDMTGKAVAL